MAHPQHDQRLQALHREIYRAAAELTVIARYTPNVRIQTTIEGPDLSATVIHGAELSGTRQAALQYAPVAMRAIEENPALTVEEFLQTMGDRAPVETAFWAARDGYAEFREVFDREYSAAVARLGIQTDGLSESAT
jgi:hypothetical protein